MLLYWIDIRFRKAIYATSRRLVSRLFHFQEKTLAISFYQEFSDFNEAMLFEKKIKGWSRIKKKALIDERWEDLKILSKNYTEFGKPQDPSTSSG